MKYALMFNVLKDGEVEPIKWGKNVFLPESSIILLEEFSPAVWLWHGTEQSLVERRIARRQAEGLKGYGYKAKDTIIGSRTRVIKEIDQRKVGKDAETDQLNGELENLLNNTFTPIDDIIVAFQLDDSKIEKIQLKPEIVSEVVPQENIEPLEKPRTKKIMEKPQIAKVETIISDTKKELKATLGAVKSKPIAKPVKKQEFSFESHVKEIEPYNAADIIQDVLKRVEKMESKLDGLMKELKELKSTIIQE